MAVASIWRRAWMRRSSGGQQQQQYDDADGGGCRPRPTGGEDAADGGCGSLQPTCGYSTTSGTTYTASTTTATSGSAGDHPLPLPTAPVVEKNPEEELDVAVELEEDRVKKFEHLKGLVLEFRGDNRSAAVQRWLSELDADWVVQLAPGTHGSSGTSFVVASHGFQFLVQSWILALRDISESILTSLDAWRRQEQKQKQKQYRGEGTSSKQPQPFASEFAQLVEATVLKMLPFVDIAASKTSDDRRPAGALAPEQTLQLLTDMHGALSIVSQHILLLESSTMGGLFSVELNKLDEAIWRTIVEMRNNIMAWTWTDDGVSSSDIHKVTHSIVSYTKVMWANHESVNLILHGAVLRGEFVSENENMSHLTNLIREMVSSLERKPSTVSFSFPDESLRFLFLANNFYYLLQELRTIFIWRFDLTTVLLPCKIDDYIGSYLCESWAPVLKCLQGPATPPRCFNRNMPPLPRFESKFQKTCAAQKLWKVPDPEMRKRLRKAIVGKVIPVLTQFLEDNSIRTPGITPGKVEKMLGELFEG